MRKGVWLVVLACVVGFACPAADDGLSAWRQMVVSNDFAACRLAMEPADRQAIYRLVCDRYGLGRIQAHVPHWVATNACERLAELALRIEDGLSLHVGATLGRKPEVRYLSVEGGACAPKADVSAAFALVRPWLAKGGSDETEYRAVSSPLTADETRIGGSLSGRTYPAPFERFWFFAADDEPFADWQHPARFVFVKDDLTAFAVVRSDEPPVVTVGGVEQDLVKIGASAALPRRAVKSVRRDNAQSVSEPFVALEGGDPAHCHAFLVLGGCNLANNHCRYWNEVCFVYNVMRQRYGLPRENIKVLWAGGDPNTDICRNGKCATGHCVGKTYVTDDLSDFDQDGANDIDGAATRENVRQAFADYAAKLTAEDQLLVFFSDHGGTYKPGEEKVKDPATVCLWRGSNKADDLKDTELAAWSREILCPVMFALKTCYSGGMISETVNSAKNRVMATADKYDQSLATEYIGAWTYYFFGALCGRYPAAYDGGACDPWAPLDPRRMGDVCAGADTDGDGRVSFTEAADFAAKMNIFPGRDSPQCQASPDTPDVGRKLFMTKYADAPTVLVRDRVATPTFVTASNQFAPYFVEASSETQNATIRYTLDGTEPTEESPDGTEGIEITADCVVTVRAFKSGMDGSSPAQAKYEVRKTAPEKARIVSVSQADSSTAITVVWLAGAGATSYDILRSTSADMAEAVVVAEGLGKDETSFADGTASKGLTYYYLVRSVNVYGSVNSEVSLASSLALNPPTDVTATVSKVVGTKATVSVSWTAAEAAVCYRVFRRSPGGKWVVVSGWVAATSFDDTVDAGVSPVAYEYAVQSAADASGEGETSLGEPAEVVVQMERVPWAVAVVDTPWGSADMPELGMEPASTNEFYVRLQTEDGQQLEVEDMNAVTCRVIQGDGVEVEMDDGSWCGPELFVKLSDRTPEQVAVLELQTTDPFGETVTREINLYVSREGVMKALAVSGYGYLVPGENQKLDVKGLCYGGKDRSLPEDMIVMWTIIEGAGATVDEDGVVTALPTAEDGASVVVQAKAETEGGEIFGTMLIDVRRVEITETSVELPPLGGASTNCIGYLPSSAYYRLGEASWLTGVGFIGSRSERIEDATIFINLGGRGSGNIGLYGSYVFLAFTTERNPGKDREMLVKLRWSDGGINYTIRQKEAPYAADPAVVVDDEGAVNVTGEEEDTSVYYATDGEEPSETSPKLSKRRLVFEHNTAVAFRAYGDWMQPSGTVHARAIGTEDKVADVKISFDPAAEGLEAPSARTYKANEMFGDLPTLTREGWFFKGWTLDESVFAAVRATDYVPGKDTTLHAIWSTVEESEPEWTALPWDFLSSMKATVVVKVADSGAVLEPSVCTVGIEDGTALCRGSTKNGFGDLESKSDAVGNGLHVFGIYGSVESGTEEGLVIRVWHSTLGFLTVRNPQLTFTADGTLGSVENPFVIEVELPAEKKEDDPSGEKNVSIADPQLSGTDLKPVAAPVAALSYTGYVTNGKEIVGLVTVKVTKKGAVTATVQLPEGTKLAKTSYKGNLGESGTAELACSKNGGKMSALVCEGLASGTIEVGNEKLGFTARSSAKEVLVDLDAFNGKVWTVALKSASAKDLPELMNGYSVLSVTGGKKGKMKVSGVLADGTKVSVTAQGMAFGDSVVVPVVYQKKTTAFSLKLLLKKDGSVQVGNVSDWTAAVGTAVWEKAIASEPGNVKAGAKFVLGMDVKDIIETFGVVDADKGKKSILPNGVPVKAVDASSGKWTLPKAGKVAFVRGSTEELDESKFTANKETDPNPAALKLTFKKKTGLFSGTFQFYQLSGGKLKKLKATVNGAVVGGTGYGSGVVKNVGAQPVTVRTNASK